MYNNILNIEDIYERMYKMEPLLNELIEYVGLTKFQHIHPKNFSDLHITENLKLPKDKPPIDSLTTIHLNYLLTDIKLIQTTNGLSSKGEVLKGDILMIHGILEEKVQYIDKSLQSTVHNTSFSLPFSTFMSVPEHILDNLEFNQIKIFIQHINTKLKNSRSLYQNINLIVYY